MTELLREVQHFQEWADTVAPDQKEGYWECDYDSWGKLKKVLFEFLSSHHFLSWSPIELQTVLYVLARAHEPGDVAFHLRQYFPELISPLTEAAIAVDEENARWQLAESLGFLNAEYADREHLLLILAQDETEYVRRIALKSLVRIGSLEVESLAEEVWNRPDLNQEWAQIMVLHCLQEIRSSKLETYLALAENDDQRYLRDYAKRIRQEIPSL